MAELHDSLIVAFRRKMLRRGLREGGTPTPAYRPDIFARKFSRDGRILEEIIVEAEIESTIFTDHTADQLVVMNEYINHRKRKRVKVRGYLLVPRRAETFANSLLESLFPDEKNIKILSKI